MVNHAGIPRSWRRARRARQDPTQQQQRHQYRQQPQPQQQQQYGAYNQQQQFQYNPHAQDGLGYATQQIANGNQYGNSMVNGSGTNYGYASQSQTWYPGVSYDPTMNVVVPGDYSPMPAYPYSYGVQNYRYMVNAQQSWPSPQELGHVGYYAGYNHHQHSRHRDNSHRNNSRAHRDNNALQNQQGSGSPDQIQTFMPDHYRPTYTGEADSDLPYDGQSAQDNVSRRPLVASRPGVEGKRLDPSVNMEPLSSYVQQMADYERQYPKPPAFSDPYALPQDTVPFAQRRVPGVRPASAMKFIPGHRALSDIEKFDRNIRELPVEEQDVREREDKVEQQVVDDQRANGKQVLSHATRQTQANEERNFTSREQTEASFELLKKANLPGQAPAEQLNKPVKDKMDRKAVPATPHGPYLSTTKTPASSPPPKRIKEEPVTSPVPETGKSTIATTSAVISRPADNGWGNFYAHIRQDDKNMVVQLQRDLGRMGGKAFRPEIRETYKDQQGHSEVAVHEKIAGNTAVKAGEEEENEDMDGGGVEIGDEQLVGVVGKE
ncbi:uncharacterized protein K460DRAFT_405232 [Cucurbitaria berberidis CBS 394.84]|uniref:Uncharacterized protein n=1 Tax=Cucurbitaria berberidis CBS 394.84 TaxID=1168544 RepID=A0A9P4L854_9PLEO|nr:uncharacterized protein K460DRAFT_405232 [Cucurbitaria berberidis CBS 394.84]KAF1844954.1 hypothetical protein K460DRAFT_405232 [Cucurbitaria berberidis CBS 394.84]